MFKVFLIDESPAQLLLTSVALIFLMVIVAFVFTYDPQRPAQLTRFKGFLIADEELQGFFGCDDADPVSFSDPNDLGVIRRYFELKQNIREPIYFDVEGRLTDEGQYGSGFDGSDTWDKNLEIHRIVSASRIERILTRVYLASEQLAVRSE